MKDAFVYKEDFWSIVLGIGLLVFGLLVYLPMKPKGIENQESIEAGLQAAEKEASFKTIAWYQSFDQLKTIKASSTGTGKWLSKLTGKPGGWTNNPLESFYLSENAAEGKNEKNTVKYEQLIGDTEGLLNGALIAEGNAKSADYKDLEKNELAIAAIDQWRKAVADEAAFKKKVSHKSYNKLPYLLMLLVFMGLLFSMASWVMLADFRNFVKGFSFVFFIAFISYFMEGQAEIKSIGFGYAAWAILIGLIISNTVGTPDWVKSALTTELYIKTGLVVLGAEILLGKILAIGLPGIFVAWVVTPVVLIVTYWFGQKILKIQSKTLNMTISADMSVCGVSAAVATAAACKATKEELTIAIGLSMIFTSVMMIVLPAIINAAGIPEVLGGAWIGGTIDATGAVVAAGAFLGEKALSVAATIKMIQNVLIGLIAFGVAVYFSSQGEDGVKVKFSWAEIWRRFPKFILGFLGASVVFSILYEAMGANNAYTFIDQGVIGGFTKNIRSWLFCIAFVSIGLSINFKDLSKHFTGGKPLLLYVCGQTFNLLLTLGMAYLMFYKVFPAITAAI